VLERLSLYKDFQEEWLVDDTGLPQISDELPELSMIPTEDIPQAVRQGAEPVPVARSKPNWALIGLGSLGLVALLAVPLTFVLRPTPPDTQTAESVPASENTASPVASPSDTLLGHLPYTEAPTSELAPVADGKVLLRRPAAEKLEAMIAAASKEGVTLVPLSGFRSVTDQNTLFFDVKAERGQAPSQRATVSAPPGYSEHHTGYAVDLGDGDAPSADLQVGFEQTKAFRWLQKNAAHYSFELSFKQNNSMGVSYEPWHWRFVGDRQSLETFYRARQKSPAADTASDLTATPSAKPGQDDLGNTVQ
jgi:zinc D-Ala-D-Ala carboxypeptidase